MKQQQYAVIVLFVLIIASSLTSLGSYSSTSRLVNEDMERALSLALEEQQSDVISQDTIRTFNSHLQISSRRMPIALKQPFSDCLTNALQQSYGC